MRHTVNSRGHRGTTSKGEEAGLQTRRNQAGERCACGSRAKSNVPLLSACLNNALLQVKNIFFKSRGSCGTLLLLVLLLRGNCCGQRITPALLPPPS